MHHTPKRLFQSAILPELLRIVTLAELPHNFLSRFWTLRKAYLVNASPEIIATPGVRYVTERERPVESNLNDSLNSCAFFKT
jgi:hypothetical protein